MKNEKLFEIIGDINEKHIKEARMEKKVKKNVRIKWGSLAACFAVIFIAVIVAINMLFDNEKIITPENVIPPVDNEYKYESGYFYNVDDGSFSTYVGGKVIPEDKIGNKIADVSVTAGWKNEAGKWTSITEKLHGEIYSITGISNDVAVALKFLDKGEAVTTTHYYVIMNPSADLAPVTDYIIAPTDPSNEMTGEIPE
ncbi:MAG: hypothetical protein E7672_00970 [Ruminococcaceae bacterium]|nr:hypothetical protein [Oscillospiraceae bacterium]